MEHLYELKDVERVYGSEERGARAVDGINLVIEPGEFLAIEGPSGSGKSTLLQLLGALDRPSSGSIVFDGKQLSKMGDRELTAVRSREIGFVFQSFNLIPTLSAAENVEAAMVPVTKHRNDRRTRVAEVLQQVGLENRMTHLPSKLSGGEQQRVAIARALANEPRVILADEPTGNLDSTTSQEVVQTLKALSKEHGVTVIVVTHAAEVARECDRRVRLRDGKVIADGTADMPPMEPVPAPPQSDVPIADVE